MAESSSNRISRMLSDLRVIDLKNELEIRGLEKSGVKQALFERLKTVGIYKNVCQLFDEIMLR